MRKYFITGLLVLIPLIITIWVIKALIDFMDQSLLLVPHAYHPETLLGLYIPGLGALLTLLIVFLTGVATANLFGRKLLEMTETVLARIPIVNSVYSSVKQVSETLFSSKGQAFRKALLVQYPRVGSWTIAFHTGQPRGEVAKYLGDEHVSVYIPTTPNPTSGFFLMMAKKDVIELEMSVDTALKYIISMGVVAPEQAKSSSARLITPERLDG